MEPIQRIPAGILSLLGVVGSGENQRSLSDTLYPTLELLEFYSARSLEIVGGSTAGLAAAGDSVSVIVPSTEFWIVHALAAAAIASALNTQLLPCVGYQIPAGSSLQVTSASDTVQVASGANDRARCGQRFRPFVLPPSSALVAQLMRASVVGTVTLQVTATIVRVVG